MTIRRKPPHLTSSYQPISLLPLSSKVFEKVLIKQVETAATENNVLPDDQLGFRKKHSIEQVH